MWTNCSFWNSTSVWTIFVKYFFSWTVNEGLLKRENHTHKLTGQKSKESLKNHCEESGYKNLSGFTQQTHTAFLQKFTSFFFVLFFSFHVGVSITPCPLHHFVWVCPTVLWNKMVPLRKAASSYHPRLCSSVKQVAPGSGRGEKSSRKDRFRSPGVLQEGDVT